MANKKSAQQYTAPAQASTTAAPADTSAEQTINAQPDQAPEGDVSNEGVRGPDAVSTSDQEGVTGPEGVAGEVGHQGIVGISAEDAAALTADLEQEIQNQSTGSTEEPAQQSAEKAPDETPAEDQSFPSQSAEAAIEPPAESPVVIQEAAPEQTSTPEAPVETVGEEAAAEEAPAEEAEPEAEVVEEVVAETPPPELTLAEGAAPVALEDGTGFTVETNQGTVEVKPIQLPPEETSIADINQMNHDDITSELERLLKDFPPAKLAPFEQIKQYIAAMSPGQMVEELTGKRHQKALFGALGQILNDTDADGSYNKSLTALLKVFDLAKAGAFHETHVYRFMDSVELREEQIKSFQRWINLLTVTASVKGRAQALRQIDFDKALQYGLSEQARQRIRSFYNI